MTKATKRRGKRTKATKHRGKSCITIDILSMGREGLTEACQRGPVGGGLSEAAQHD